jgi:S1-C subfamily serine protease
MVATFALVGSGCTGTATSPADSRTTSSTTASGGGNIGPGTAGPSGAAGSGGLADVPAVATRVQPSVVTVLVGGGNGSGVIYTADGLILTNEHVVRGNNQVQVAFADGQRVPGSVAATDAVTDIALVQVQRNSLPAAKFDTKLPQVGSLAVVLGSPLGFQNTVTAGVVSGLHRDIPGSAAQSQSLVDLIQTDAPISPGNSGGAVADADGEVIGISEAYIPPQAGAVALGFAIPAATVVDVADQLRRTGRARHAFAGLAPAPITPSVAAQFGLSTTDGVIVAELSTGGPADNAGLKRGDIITAVDGQPTRTPEEFLAVLRRHNPGDTLTLTVHFPGQPERQARLTVSDRPAS